jgi:hypothetical protein
MKKYVGYYTIYRDMTIEFMAENDSEADRVFARMTDEQLINEGEQSGELTISEDNSILEKTWNDTKEEK